MPKDEEELQKHTLNLFAGDYQKVQDAFPDIGAGPVIRRIVRKFIERIEAGVPAEIDANVEVKI